MNIELAEEKAYLKLPLHLIVLSDFAGKSYRCSKRALKNLLEGFSGCNVVSTEIDGEIVWVSIEEFKANKLIEKQNVECSDESPFSNKYDIEEYYDELREKYEF